MNITILFNTVVEKSSPKENFVTKAILERSFLKFRRLSVKIVSAPTPPMTLPEKNSCDFPASFQNFVLFRNRIHSNIWSTMIH